MKKKKLHKMQSAEHKQLFLIKTTAAAGFTVHLVAFVSIMSVHLKQELWLCSCLSLTLITKSELQQLCVVRAHVLSVLFPNQMQTK